MKIEKLSLSNLEELNQIYINELKEQAISKQQIEKSLNNKNYEYYGIIENQEVVCFACILKTLDDINLLDIATKEKYKRKGMM